MNYYRFYVGDYIRDTSKLSMLEHGAYGLMLHYYFAEELPLPLDRNEIYTMVRAMTPDGRKAVDKVLAKYFQLQADGYHNDRADQELFKAAPLIEAARINGAKGGRRKNPADNPTGSEKESQQESEKEPSGIPSGQHTPTTILHTPATSPQPSTTNPQKSKADARATRLPADWVLPKEWGGWAVKNRGWSAAQAHAVSEEFRDYWIAKPGKDGRKLDWQATWRNWCRKQRGISGNPIVPIKPVDTSCRRELRGTKQLCGMPGKPHVIYGYSCDACNLKDELALQNRNIPAGVRDALKLSKGSA